MICCRRSGEPGERLLRACCFMRHATRESAHLGLAALIPSLPAACTLVFLKCRRAMHLKIRPSRGYGPPTGRLPRRNSQHTMLQSGRQTHQFCAGVIRWEHYLRGWQGSSAIQRRWWSDHFVPSASAAAGVEVVVVTVVTVPVVGLEGRQQRQVVRQQRQQAGVRVGGGQARWRRRRRARQLVQPARRQRGGMTGGMTTAPAARLRHALASQA